MNLRLCTVLAVLGVHALGLWALQSGLLRPAVERLDPALVMADVMVAAPTPPAPPLAAPPPPQARPPQPPRAAAPVSQPPRPLQPAAIPAPASPAALEPPTSPAPSPAPASAWAEPARASVDSAPATPPAVAAPNRVELPSSSADYLHNPRPPYPALSRRLGEQGKVVVRVLIDANGTPSQAEVRSSSGYERLDQTAVQTVLRWRYVPGKRNGMPEAMWFNVPIHFVLD